MLRVLFTSHTARLTGSAMSLYTLVAGLSRREFEPLVVLAQDGPLAGLLRAANVPTRLVPFDGLARVLAVRRLATLARAHRADLVYANCAVSFSRAAAQAARSCELPVMWHLREDPQGGRALKQRPWMQRLASQVVVVSEEQRRALADTLPADLPVEQVDNGVNLQRFAPGRDGGAFRQAHGLAPDAFVFGIVGTLEPRKNQQQFLQAARALAGRHANARFLLVGSGRPEPVQALKDSAAVPELAGRVVWAGELAAMEDAYAAIDCLVMPSLWEGFPRVLLEAMATGTPAVASDVGQVRAMTDGGRCAQLVPPGDLAALTAAMEQALCDPAARATEAACALERVRGHFGSDAYLQRMAALMHRTVQRHQLPAEAALRAGIG